MDEDSFDDDDIDFDQLLQAHTQQATQHVKEIPVQILKPPQLPKPQAIANSQIKKQTNSECADIDPDIFTLKGENSILRAKLDNLTKEKEEEKKKLKSHFNNLIKDKDSKLVALNENLNKLKSSNEFLSSENKSLYQSSSKKRKIQVDDEEANNTTSTTTTSAETSANTTKSTQCTEVEQPTLSKTTVIVMNQATVFQDEKILFIESISAYVISGMSKPTLDYLSHISSNFDYSFKDFKVVKRNHNFKAIILNYLIGFEDKNRIDILISRFIEILFDYIIKCFNDKNNISLLPIPYFLSLISFSLNYRPKAISVDLINQTTIQVVSLLMKFPDILKQEFAYLSLPNSNKDDEMIDEITNNFEMKNIDFNFIDKTMHNKFLEVFTTVYLMDILETLSRLSNFNNKLFPNFKALQNFWSKLPNQLLINNLLSTKTPTRFIHNTLEILINSIFDDNKFAYYNIKSNSAKAKNDYKSGVEGIVNNLIILLKSTPTEYDFHIFGLNHSMGSNRQTSLLDLLSPKDEISSKAETHSFDTYENMLNPTNIPLLDEEFYQLYNKLRILQFFEIFLTVSYSLDLSVNKILNLIESMSDLLGQQQEMIFRSPRSVNIKIRIEIISSIVKLIHFFVSTDPGIEIGNLNNLTLREIIIGLLRISSNNLKNLSIDFIFKVRSNEKFNGLLFNSELEKNELDKFGIWNELNTDDYKNYLQQRIEIESELSNGVEFNYSDEIIEMARDIIGLCVTGDEADRLHYSINYDINHDLEDEEMML